MQWQLCNGSANRPDGTEPVYDYDGSMVVDWRYWVRTYTTGFFTLPFGKDRWYSWMRTPWFSIGAYKKAEIVTNDSMNSGIAVHWGLNNRFGRITPGASLYRRSRRFFWKQEPYTPPIESELRVILPVVNNSHL
jgi:hypothetical protein